MRYTWQSEGVPVVFTDGACSSNGHRGAKAGIGVFWGDDHPDNVSEPLMSGPPTNNRAELSAVITALRTVRLLSDLSSMSINCSSWQSNMIHGFFFVS
uniref:ribonuclease H n=1 Tax=Parascaris equorum TaxID=6256 RepID=A0A914RWV3_PAREQ